MKYRKKPVVIEAMQLTTDNYDEVCDFIASTPAKVNERAMPTPDGGWTHTYDGVVIRTLEGDMLASIGDYIIKGVKGEFYPCKPDVFEQTYENADGEEMLTVSRKKVQEFYAKCKEVTKNPYSYPDYSHESALSRMALLDILFGSKCLPDNVANEVNFANKESKFRKGDKFRYKKNPGEVYTVDHITNDGKVYYWDKDADGVSKVCFVNPDYIEPYTEPEEKLGMDAQGWFRIDTDAIGNKIKVRIPSGVTDPYTEPKEESLQMKPIESKVSVYLATKEEEEFRLLLHENGFTWNSGTSLKGCSFWVNRTEESKILYVHPDMTVTHWGNKTFDTLTFSEFKKRYFKCNDHIVQDHEMVDSIIKHGFKNHNRLHIAAMIAAGWIAHDGPKNMDPDIMAADSLTIADALIAESEKGGSK